MTNKDKAKNYFDKKFNKWFKELFGRNFDVNNSYDRDIGYRWTSKELVNERLKRVKAEKQLLFREIKKL